MKDEGRGRFSGVSQFATGPPSLVILGRGRRPPRGAFAALGGRGVAGGRAGFAAGADAAGVAFDKRAVLDCAPAGLFCAPGEETFGAGPFLAGVRDSAAPIAFSFEAAFLTAFLTAFLPFAAIFLTRDTAFLRAGLVFCVAFPFPFLLLAAGAAGFVFFFATFRAAAFFPGLNVLGREARALPALLPTFLLAGREPAFFPFAIGISFSTPSRA